MDLKLGFFASHSGSNVEAILQNIDSGYLNAESKIVISNNRSAKVFDRARKYKVPHLCLNENNYPFYMNSLEDSIINILQRYDVNLIVLAGYMKKIDRKLIRNYPNRILNIHPALLPKYGGKGKYGANVHKAVIKSNDIESGPTVHIVNERYDKGPILDQIKVPRKKDDTPDTLAARVLKFEHVLYSQVLKNIEDDIIDLDNPPKF